MTFIPNAFMGCLFSFSTISASRMDPKMCAGSCWCVILLVEVGLGNVEEGAVSVRSDGEDERFPREHGQVTHHLSRVGDKQQRFLFPVDHPLVHVKQPRDDECHTRILSVKRMEKTGLGLTGNSTLGIFESEGGESEDVSFSGLCQHTDLISLVGHDRTGSDLAKGHLPLQSTGILENRE